jgi:hypothetical protein
MSEFNESTVTGKTFISGNTFSNKEVTYAVVDGRAMLEGCIDLGSVEEVEEIRRQVEEGEVPAVDFGVAITGDRFRWPNGVVPFTIDPSLPNQARVTDAIAHIQARTNLVFVPRSSQPNFINFRPGGGCSSNIGMIGGRQSVNLAPGCTTGSTIHEICHALGLWHEQSREDRDNFVTINFANVEPEMRHNFDQQITDGDDIGSYDFGSIMHYGRNFFAINPAVDTITPKPNANIVIGQRTGLSPGDIATLATLYPPYQRFLLQTGVPLLQNDAAANFDFGVGLFNGDRNVDLFCLKKRNTSSGKLEVHILDGTRNFQSFLLQRPTPIAAAEAANMAFAVGDFNRDNRHDLFCMKRANSASGRLEVQILSGSSNYQTSLRQTATPITAADAANMVFAAGDSNGDGIADLYCIKRANTGSGRLEVHILNGATNFQTFLLQIGTPVTLADAANMSFAVGHFNRDGKPDLYCIRKGASRMEVNILHGSSSYQTFALQTPTPILAADAANFEFAAGDLNGDGNTDLIGIKKANTGTTRLEVHVLDGPR